MKIIKNVLISIEKSDIINGILILPKNVKIIGDKAIECQETLINVIGSKVTTIGNDNFYECNAMTTANFPLVTTIGNYNFYECNAMTTANFPLVTTIGDDNFRICNAMTTANFNKIKLDVKCIDAGLFIIHSVKTSKGIKIYTGANFLNIKKNELYSNDCFVAEKDGFYAHGNTIKKSIQDLQFKIASQKLKNEPISQDTMIDINYYRLITGACEFGVNKWVNQNNISVEKMRADKLLPILEKSNAYGIEKFKQLVNF